MRRKLNILLIMDIGETFAPEELPSLVKGEDFKHEVNVINALKRLGHEVSLLGIFDDVVPLLTQLEKDRPDVAFVMCESFRGKRGHEDHIVGLLEMYGIPYTGADAKALSLCRDKALTKIVLAHEGLEVPKFAVVSPQTPTSQIDASIFPAICKPLGQEASEGISLGSLVQTHEELAERVSFLHRKYASDVIVEEFIGGDEYYVGVIGNDRLTAFPPQVLKYKNWPKGKPQIFSYKAKWDNNYRKKWGIDSQEAKIDPTLEKDIIDYAKRTYRILGLKGYARLDLRLRDNKPVLLEANPNPGIGRYDDFALSAQHGGWSYDELIQKIVRLALGSASDLRAAA